MPNYFGKESLLEIKAAVKEGATVLEDAFFTAPYKIAKPFYNEKDNLMHLMVMAASAGIMEGDCYKISIELGVGARVALKGQSYNKIHRMKQGWASQQHRFYLEEQAFLDYNQNPTIPFAESKFHSSLECHIKRGAAFLYSEVLSCGREKSGEGFQFGLYKNCNKVYYEGELIFLDHQLLVPKEQNLFEVGFFEGYTHQATLAYFHDGPLEEVIEGIFSILEHVDDSAFGVTKTKKHGLMVRVLSNSSDYLEKVLDKLRQFIYSSHSVASSSREYLQP